jgi:hypothetical protein
MPEPFQAPGKVRARAQSPVQLPVRTPLEREALESQDMRPLILMAISVSTFIADLPPIQTVAAVIAGEARGEGRVGMMAVAEVIRQRCLETGSRPEVVVMAGFACLNNTTPARLYRRIQSGGAPDERALLTAELYATWLFTAPQKLSNLTRGATHYHEINSRPTWSRSPGARWTATIGRHVFYRIERQ